ncbi:signal protein PDZ [Prochlorococcus sp. MIT 1300]|uniref:M61 family metallopeptidase n=1 Tax=Prochlorococcus sp. MIT 1300 TaxID=3096218 RepID=UPI002A7646D0|nr:signal protein PDZ [Prochlorococcus sp. MIT 1300]
MIDIFLDLTQASYQRIHVTLQWKPKSNYLLWSLPIWTPGSYTVRDHSQHLHSTKVSQLSKSIDFVRLSTSSWECYLQNQSKVSLSYIIEAHELSVRSSFIDPEFASLCLSSVVTLIEGMRYDEHRLYVNLPSGWTSYTTLDFSNFYKAEDYDQLVDSPLHAGVFKTYDISVKTFKHKLILLDNLPQPLPSNIDIDVSKICEACCDLLGSAPPSANKYQFIVLLLRKGYGGLEHNDSSTIAYDWNSITNKDGYRKFLQLLGHEYLHQWNVRRLRPREYLKYDYNNVVLSDSLWFAEGVTSYYDTALTFISKITDQNSYLNDLSNDILSFLNYNGLKVQSLADSSREAWIKLYKQNPSSINNQVSYYKLGAAMSFCMDVLLRQLNSSLSYILRSLWHKYGITNLGYTRIDIVNEIKEVSESLADKISIWLDETDALPIRECAQIVGLKLEPTQINDIYTGLTLKTVGERILVKQIDLNSPGSLAELIIEDEIIAINDFRLLEISELKLYLKERTSNTITYSRRNRIYTSVIKLPSRTFNSFEFRIDEDAPESAKNLRDRWLRFI